MKQAERWPNKWSKVKTLQDKPRSGGPFFHKMCEKYYRKSCKYMRNNSTKQKGKKNSTSHYRSKFRAQQYGDKLTKKKVGKPWREKGGAHFMQAHCGDWTTTCVHRWEKIACSILRCKNVTLDMLWELVHSISHRLESAVRRHKRRHSGY